MIQYKPWGNDVVRDLLDESNKGIFSCLDIELSGECPYKCVYCETPYRDRKAKIDIDKICALLDTKRFKWLYICGIGEPTYGENEKKLLKILESCKKNDVKCSIFTNLSNLSKEFIEYIELGILFCLFKFDSQSPKILEQIYNPSDLNQHLININKLTNLVQSDGKYTNIAASIVPTKANIEEIPNLVRWCLDHKIFPLVAQLEYAGAAKNVFEDLFLTDEELDNLKIHINEILGEEYSVPFCPSVIAGICITYDNEIVIDRRSGLSCHSFWLEDPIRDIVCENVSELFSVDDIVKKVINARAERYETFITNISNYKFDVFGGCGGNKKDLFNRYKDVMDKGYYSHPYNDDNLLINRFVYLDNNATTKTSKQVQEIIQSTLEKNFTNPNSKSHLAMRNRIVIEDARKIIADTLFCKSDEIYFTSSGSESNSWAINSCINNVKRKDKKIILSTLIEHKSILNHLHKLNKDGYEILNIPINENGNIDIEAFLNTSPKWDDICFATVMYANNETGVINDIEKLSNILRSHHIPLHCDAVQAFGKIRINLTKLKVDYLSISGHKIHAPKGIGVLYVNQNSYLEPLIFGEQENKMRGGTENVAYIAGIGEATKNIYSNDNSTFEERIDRIAAYRDKIENKLEEVFGCDIIINGKSTDRLSNTTNIGFKSINAVNLSLMLEKRGIYVSNGAACNINNPLQSHVLKAMNSPVYKNGAIRISLSDETQERDIYYFLDNLIETIKKLTGGN